MWQQTIIPGCGSDGKPILSVIARRSYSIAPGKVAPAQIQLPLAESDVFENPDQFLFSEVEAETDLVVCKLTTDVIVKGRACSPSGKKAYFLDCFVSAGALNKTVRVFGNRTVKKRGMHGLVFSDPQPFTEMELGYKYAYGGTASTAKGILYTYLPNPIGKGLNFKGGLKDPGEIEVPHLEDPLSPVTAEKLILSKPEDRICAPRPASFGWTRRNFYPRYTYAGILSQHRKPGKAPIDRSDKMVLSGFDYRFYQGASDGLWGEQLRGDEPVKLNFFDKDNPELEFELPGEIPTLTLDLGEGKESLSAVLQTVIIDMNCKLLSMVWRGSKEYEGVQQLSAIKRLDYSAY